MSLPGAICIMGPTASGKSALALALARRFPAEIISVDSAQVYRGMDIGTAKPDARERAACTHHLIDIVEPTGSYSAARFALDARRLIGEIRARGRLALLVGGTMLYFKALRVGIDALPDAHPEIRLAIEQAAARDGWPSLHAELARCDPDSAQRIKPNDAQRIQRALEVCRVTGRPMSALLGTRSDRSPLDALWIALMPSDRSALHARIAARLDAMLAAGLVEELRALRAHFALSADLPAMRCVGYRQAWRFLEGEIDAATLRAHALAATRQLAKRQLTWLRATPADLVLDPLEPDLLSRTLTALGS